MTEWAGGVLIGLGVVFFLIGSIGMLRLPDLYSRLHALTKADNLGLGLIVTGAMLIGADLRTGLLLLLIWLLVLAASSASAHMIAQHMLRRERTDGR